MAFLPSKLDSTKHWQVSYIKSPGRPAVVSATHGTLKRGDGFTTFEWADPITAHRHPATRVEIVGRATEQRKIGALLLLRQQMRDAGLID